MHPFGGITQTTQGVCNWKMNCASSHTRGVQLLDPSSRAQRREEEKQYAHRKSFSLCFGVTE